MQTEVPQKCLLVILNMVRHVHVQRETESNFTLQVNVHISLGKQTAPTLFHALLYCSRLIIVL